MEAPSRQRQLLDEVDAGHVAAVAALLESPRSARIVRRRRRSALSRPRSRRRLVKLDHSDESGLLTPLYLAASHGFRSPRRGARCASSRARLTRPDHPLAPDSDIVELLLNAGATVDALGGQTSPLPGMTALHVAAFNGHKRVVEQLLRAGASVERGSAFGRVTPRMFAIAQQHEAVRHVLDSAGAVRELVGEVGRLCRFVRLTCRL